MYLVSSNRLFVTCEGDGGSRQAAHRYFGLIYSHAGTGTQETVFPISRKSSL